MRAGMVLPLFVVLLLTASGSLLVRGAAERRFDPVAGTPPPVTALASRCYTLAIQEPDSTSGWVPLRTPVCLTAAPAAGPGAAGWNAALAAAPDSARYRFARYAAPARWRPVGADSLDLHFPDRPVSVRLRIPTAGAVSRGRLIPQGDVSTVIGFKGSLYAINWPPVYRVHAVRIDFREPAT